MDTNILIQKVLDLAIQGKLIPQNPKDEPASVLLEHIREEKAKMVKKGLLKKKDIQNNTNIFIGDDGKHYEKFADGKVKCIEKEIYFELPDGWCWGRLKDICSMSAGKVKARESIYCDSSEGRYPCFGGNGIRGYVEEYSHDGMYNIIGRQGALCGNITIAEGKFYATEHAVVVTLFDGIDFQWSNYMLQASHLNDYATGAAQPGLSVANILNVLVAIPPFSEQVRIGKLINSTINIINTIENDERLIKELSSLTKSKVLDLAIRGQLVPQDQNDEPASVLMDRIKAKREKLIKEGKIKRYKHESVICRKGNSYYETVDEVEQCIDDELPFDIPDSWEWIRIKSCTYLYNGKAFKPSDWTKEGLPIVRIQNLNDPSAPFNHFKGMLEPEFTLYGGELLFAWSASFGAYIWKEEKAALNQHIYKLEFDENLIYKLYYMYVLNQMTKEIMGVVHGTGMQHVTKGVFENTLIPLPPIPEQKRIVSKIEKILSAIEEF